MADDDSQQSLIEKVWEKISLATKSVSSDNADNNDDRPRVYCKKCPACNTEYFDTNLVVCPKDRTMLLTPQVGNWSWFDFALSTEKSPVVMRCPKCEGIFYEGYRKCPKDRADLTASDFSSLESPVLENRYQLVSYLCEDRLFDSFLARDLTSKDVVAVHFVSKRISLDPKSLSHFLKFGKTAIDLEHPNLLRVYSVNVTSENTEPYLQYMRPSAPYMVSEYMISNSLCQEIRTRRCFDVASAARIFVDILGALSYAHERGIMHGAIDTHNLRVAGGSGSRGHGILSNFGMAERLFQQVDWEGPSTDTRTANIYGNPDGISPEICRGERPTIFTDQYQIGCALYEALCGRPPFERPVLTQILLAHMKDDPDDITKKNSDIPEELVKVVLKTLQKDPIDRFPSVQALSKELERFMNP